MTRKKVICIPRFKVDTFWTAEWYELTGIFPDAKKIRAAVLNFTSDQKKFDCKRGRPRKKVD